MPLLSVCIPTYNQPESVALLLGSLCDQYHSEVEIVVCDDSSNDETKHVVDSFLARLPVRYIRRSREGLDSAVIELVRVATGDYVWWVGDDMLLPGAISRVCDLLSDNRDLIFLWLNSCDITNSNLLTIDETSTSILNNRNFLLRYDIGLLGFITATMFRRDVALRCLDDAKKHIGSAFACLYIVLYVLSQPGRLGIIGEPYFASRPKPSGEVRWYDQYQVFGINLFQIANEFQHVFDKTALKRALADNLVRVLKSVIVERALGMHTGFASPSVSMKPLLVNYYNYWQLWVFLPIMLLPASVLKFLYRGYKAFA